LQQFGFFAKIVLGAILFSSKSVSTKESISTKNSVPIVANRLEQAQDVNKKWDVWQLAVALKGYHDANHKYPQNLTELAASGGVFVPTPPPNSEPQDQYGYLTCFSQGAMQAVIYTRLAENKHYYVYRTITGTHGDSGSSQTPSCP